MKRRASGHLVHLSLLLLAASALARGHAAEANPYSAWPHSGALWILTTPDGADLPAASVEPEFPLLVRLHRDTFDFNQAQSDGADVRFSSSSGTALAFQVEEWDAARGTASIWVRVPFIHGDTRQEIRMHWGKPDARKESNGAAVFSDSNGYLSVWHMTAPLKDEVGTLTSKDVATSATNGMIGPARHLAGKQGVFGGDSILSYPTGAVAHSTEAWFRAEKPNVTIVAWGNEPGGRGTKVRMQLRSPPHVHVDSNFSDVKAPRRLQLGEWVHVAHTYARGEGKLYINGQLDGTATPMLSIKSPARLWLGGWYHHYDFVGDLDEVRISKVTRSADWVRLEYENQKPMQTLVGSLVQAGNAFTVAPSQIVVAEGRSVTVSAQAGGAQKVYWILQRDGTETVVAVDRFRFTFEAGRVVGNQSARLQFKAVFAHGVKAQNVAIAIQEAIPEPAFTLEAPAHWNGRETIEVVARVSNLAAMQARGAGQLTHHWNVSGLATIQETTANKLILKRAQNSGTLRVTLALSNGGLAATQSTTIDVSEPKHDAWVQRMPAVEEMPEDNQFIARDGANEGTIYCRGLLTEAAESVFLKVYDGERLIHTEMQHPRAGKAYALSARLKPGLVKYRTEFGTKAGDRETVLHTATNLVCGDVFIIQGQSNALATDTGEKAPAETSDWIRTYGSTSGNPQNARLKLWGNAVWKERDGERLQLGYWGMELARRLVASQQIPICLINGAVGGTRIDQHQRNPTNHDDVATIYGRLFWRVQQAKLTHGIRGILWHQGENDQGADGPTGGFGWETYHSNFVQMAAAWKQDYPNVQHYYVFQIWPKACAMGVNGSDNKLREAQRTLPSLFSRMSIMSTLGIKPPGGCHYPLEGWAEFARLIQPLIERDHYGKTSSTSITPPNLVKARFTSERADGIALEFDQPVVWSNTLMNQFHLPGVETEIASGTGRGRVLTLQLSAPTTARQLTYLDSKSWNPTHLLYGANGIAALTFCEVPIEPE